MRALRPCAVIGKIATLVSLLASMACSSETGGPSATGPRAAPATANELDGLCSAECARSAKCSTAQTPDEQVATCSAKCKEHLGNLATAIRGDRTISGSTLPPTNCEAVLARTEKSRAMAAAGQTAMIELGRSQEPAFPSPRFEGRPPAK